jgi:hypothetical protein
VTEPSRQHVFDRVFPDVRATKSISMVSALGRYGLLLKKNRGILCTTASCEQSVDPEISMKMLYRQCRSLPAVNLSRAISKVVAAADFQFPLYLGKVVSVVRSQIYAAL